MRGARLTDLCQRLARFEKRRIIASRCLRALSLSLSLSLQQPKRQQQHQQQQSPTAAFVYLDLSIQYAEPPKRHNIITNMNFDDAATKETALQQLVRVVPVVPFHGVESFYDIGGLLAHPTELQLALDLMAHEVAKIADDIDSIGCFDARGFLFAPYLGVLFKKKVFMLRKPGKMPSVSHTLEYFKEYSGDNATTGGDHLCIQEYAVKTGDRVLLVDDLLATGGTVEAGIKLVQQAGGVVKAALFAVEIGVLNGRGRAQAAAPDAAIIALLNEKSFESKQ